VPTHRVEEATVAGKKQTGQLIDAVNYGALGFGAVAVLAPRLFAGLYGLKGDGNVLAMIRLWGTRTAALGAIGVLTKGTSNYRTLLTVGAAMSTVDALVIAGAGPDVALRARAMGSLTSAAFAGAQGYVVSQD
jgi:hypothetical protein